MRKRIGYFLIVLIGGFVLPVRGQELVFCGWDEVFIVDTGTADSRDLEKVWSWKAEGSSELPEEMRGAFGTTDDCKPVDGGKRILISSSGGGAALVERLTGRVQWYGCVGNAHSIELLPGNRVVVAGSTHPEGNRLSVFDLDTPEQVLFEESLYSGHGVVWDSERRRLWALGYDELRLYRLGDWETAQPKLLKEKVFHLPSSGGHDLSWVPDRSALVVTTNESVYLFDCETQAFSPHFDLRGLERIKSVSIHPTTGQLAYTQAEGENWWTTRVEFLYPTKTLFFSQERLYKVRWVTAATSR